MTFVNDFELCAIRKVHFMASTTFAYVLVLIIFGAVLAYVLIYGASPNTNVSGLAPNSQSQPVQVSANPPPGSGTHQSNATAPRIPTLTCAQSTPCAINLTTGTKSCRDDRSYFPTIESCTTANGCPSYAPYSVSTDGSTSNGPCLTDRCRCTNLLNRGRNVNSVFNIDNRNRDYTVSVQADFNSPAKDRITIPATLRSLVTPGCAYGELIMYDWKSALRYQQIEFGSIYPPTSTIPIACVKASASGNRVFFDRASGKVTILDNAKAPTSTALTSNHRVTIRINNRSTALGSFTITAGTSYADLPAILTQQTNEIDPFDVTVTYQYGQRNGNLYLEVRLALSRVNSVQIDSSLWRPIGFLSSTIQLTNATPIVRAVTPSTVV